MTGEVVITRSSKVVLDIGLKLPSGKIRAHRGLFDVDAVYYGSCSNFVGTNITMEEEAWDKITYCKTTKEICDDLFITYSFSDSCDANDDMSLTEKHNLKKDLYDNICNNSDLIANLIKKNMVKVFDESYSIALKMALNKYRTLDGEKFEEWLMQQIEILGA